ncbi:MAG: hypothetical protein ACRETC_07335, partial [Gammaproteobacteria bacterium]
PWTGPEVMCFILTLAGLLLLETRRFGWALLAFAVAAQQNPPIGLLAVVTGIAGCLDSWRRWKRLENGKRVLSRLLTLVPGAAVLIASPLFYWAEFGTPNLIIKAGGTNPNLVSWERLVSLLFDVNQGMVVAMPGLFLAVFIMLVMGAGKQKRVCWVAGGLVAAMLVMALPVLSQTNWNGGEIIISRYAYWLSALLIYACVLLMDGLLGKYMFPTFASALVAVQCAVLAWLGVFGTAYFYVGEGPLAMWVLNHHPSWYNPVPEIFVERGLHREGGPDDGTSYLYVYKGRITVMLVKKRHLFSLEAICPAGVANVSGRSLEQGWRYLYTKNQCRLSVADGFYTFPSPPKRLVASAPNQMNFASGYVDDALPGFKTPENWGVWSNQRVALLPLLLPSTDGDHAVAQWRVTLKFHPFVVSPGPIRSQHVIVYANGMEVLNMQFATDATVERTFVARGRIWRGQESSMLLEFHIPTAISYKQLGLSQDPSQLGIGLQSVRVEPIE